MMWWKTCLKGTSTNLKDFFSSTKKDLMTWWLDDLMKDWFEGIFKNSGRLLLLQQSTWWLDERHVWRELRKLRNTSSSSIKDLMTWWKTDLKGTLKSKGDFFFFILQQKTWWLDERHVWRELQKLRITSYSSSKDLMTWWKTCLKGTSKT